MNLYQEKNLKYFNNPRYDLIQFIPKGKQNKILELGVGSGDTLIEIKNLNLAEEVVGIELIKLENSNQNSPFIDKLLFGNIETMDIDLPQNYFDVILIGDVLEHLIDPWNTLNKLHLLLKNNGVIIASIPNFREYQNLKKILLNANFKYEDDGILDKTHLRFFCKQNIVSLFKTTQYNPECVYSNFLIEKKFSKKKLFNMLTFGIFRDFLTRQYIVIARKK